jgi:hypothetical protein
MLRFQYSGRGDPYSSLPCGGHAQSLPRVGVVVVPAPVVASTKVRGSAFSRCFHCPGRKGPLSTLRVPTKTS